MKHTDGVMLGLIGGVAYLGFVFVLGWEAGGVLSSFIWAIVACLFTVGAMRVLVSSFPPSRVWPYPLSFAAPLLAVGVLAFTSEVPIPTFLVIGLGTLVVGLSATHWLMRRARSGPPRIPEC
ncbi:MAG TPA: hypothetical protein VIY48_06310 [Candidatus Paceibacterota bacterium]